MPIAVVGLALGSSLAAAVSTTLKKAAANRAPAATGGGVRGAARFATATLRSPWWLLAVVADLVGVGLQIAALHLGGLALVQPLLISGLLFALLLRHLRHWRMTWLEAGWALLLAACLIAFMSVSGAIHGAPAGHADRGVAVVAALGAGLGVVFCVLVARRDLPPAGRAALLGAAVGTIYATTAALIKSATGVFAERGVVALLASWQLYTALTVAAAGLYLGQLALQAGPLTASLPATATLDPLLSVVIGVTVYDEHLSRGPGHGAVLLLLVALLIIAVLGLTRVEETSVRPRPPRRRGPATGPGSVSSTPEPGAPPPGQ